MSSSPRSLSQAGLALREWRLRQWATAGAGALLTALAVGTPTDVVPNPFFSRSVPVQWWNYPALSRHGRSGWTCSGHLRARPLRTCGAEPVRPSTSRVARRIPVVHGGRLSSLQQGCAAPPRNLRSPQLLGATAADGGHRLRSAPRRSRPAPPVGPVGMPDVRQHLRSVGTAEPRTVRSGASSRPGQRSLCERAGDFGEGGRAGLEVPSSARTPDTCGVLRTSPSAVPGGPTTICADCAPRLNGPATGTIATITVLSGGRYAQAATPSRETAWSS